MPTIEGREPGLYMATCITALRAALAEPEEPNDD